MPGGPVNGAYNYIAKNSTALVIPTILQMSADALSYFTNLTCLYDRYWTVDPDKVTLPICMFNVKKITPTYSVETSNKRVLVYEQKTEGNLSDNMRGSVMRAVVDNSVKQPTTYNMEIIVPFQPVGRYITDSTKFVADMITGFIELADKRDSIGAQVWEGIFSVTEMILKAANIAVDSAGKLMSMDSAAYINMNSLEAMAESCRTLCMKMWTGFQYKYVEIVNMVPDKQPTEDDVYRVSLQLKEIPVLTMSPPDNKRALNEKQHWIIRSIRDSQAAAVTPFIGLTGVTAADAAGDGGAVGEMLGMIRSKK